MTELHAAANVVLLPQFLPFNDPSFPVSASTGPQGSGEQWVVSQVQVQTSSQYGQPPLVVQQVVAQARGQTTSPPPPITAQVWHAIGGQPVYLLAQTGQGGNDNVGISCPALSAGEAIMVIWYGLSPRAVVPFPSAWFALRGTKITLSET